MMKTINVFALCSIMLIVACAQKNELTVVEPASPQEPIVELNAKKDSVLFTAFVFGNQQILTAEGDVYFLNHDGEKIDQPFIGLCGTVPHYELTIESLESEFVLYSDETFYDSGNEITPEVMVRISKEKADSVKWLNNQAHFMYTSNSTIGVFNGVPPDTYFIYKDGKVKISTDDTGTWYDRAEANNFHIVVEKDGKRGVFGITDLMFSDVQPFNYYLARYTDLYGNQGYFSTDAQVFPDGGLALYLGMDPENIHFIRKACWDRFQILTASNRIVYRDSNGWEYSSPTEGFMFELFDLFLHQIDAKESNILVNFDESADQYFDVQRDKLSLKISYDKADSVTWQDGSKSFFFTSNYYYHEGIDVPPDTYFIFKNGKVRLSIDSTNTWFDSVVSLNGKLLVEKGGQKAIFGVTDFVFRDVEPFNYYLARYTDLQGNQGYVSADGELFPDGE